MLVRNTILVELQKAGSYIRNSKILHARKIKKQRDVSSIIYEELYMDPLQEIFFFANLLIANININKRYVTMKPAN
jgi:hypothetical protein